MQPVAYRTKTYVAGDWSADEDLIRQLYEWKNNPFRDLHFSDAHEYTQARDTSLNCSIKTSLWERLRRSRQFILVVGSHTDSLRSGSCSLCKSYNRDLNYCGRDRSRSLDMRSFVEYECEYAANNISDVVVLYRYQTVMKSQCPEVLRDVGLHVPARIWSPRSGEYKWDYEAIRRAINRWG